MVRRAIVLVCGALALGCQSENVECSCAPAGVQIRDGSQVRDLTFGGPACGDASITSDKTDGTQVNGFVPHAHRYSIMPPRSGDCLVHMAMDDGTVVDQTYAMRFKEGDGCCSGMASVVGFSERVSPAVDAGAD